MRCGIFGLCAFVALLAGGFSVVVLRGKLFVRPSPVVGKFTFAPLTGKCLFTVFNRRGIVEIPGFFVVAGVCRGGRSLIVVFICVAGGVFCAGVSLVSRKNGFATLFANAFLLQFYGFVEHGVLLVGRHFCESLHAVLHKHSCRVGFEFCYYFVQSLYAVVVFSFLANHACAFAQASAAGGKLVAAVVDAGEFQQQRSFFHAAARGF